MELDIDGRGTTVTNGTGIFIVAGAVHTFFATEHNEFVVLDVPPDLLVAEQAMPSSTRDAAFQVGPAAQGLIDNLVATLGLSGALSAEARTAWSLLLFESLAHESKRPLDPGDLAVQRAVAFMRAHLSHVVHVDDIAIAAGMSRASLHALFRARLKTSPHVLLVEMRLRAARRMLETTDLPVIEIALKTGHADQSALTRRLRLAHGTTPAALRRQSRNGFA